MSDQYKGTCPGQLKSLGDDEETIYLRHSAMWIALLCQPFEVLSALSGYCFSKLDPSEGDLPV